MDTRRRPRSGSGGRGSTGGRPEEQARRRLEPAARAGYAVSGVLHLLIGYLAVRLALGGSPSTSADQTGALAQIASKPFGAVLLWVSALALLALALWQAASAVLALRAHPRDAGEAAKGGAKTVVYLVLAWTASTFARGGGSSSEQKSTDVTARLLQSGPGTLLVVLVGLALLGVGGYHVHKGGKRKFLEELRALPPGGAGTGVRVAGTAGYAAKGIALAVLGVLFVLAAVHRDPQQAGGLDSALRTLGQQPFGAVLLALVGLGFAAYGVYSFARARWART